MLDPIHLLQGAGVAGGLLIIGGIIFAESGLLIGFFLPGDTLLFTAGFFAAQGQLPLAAVLGVIFLAAVMGDNVGYSIGKRAGPRIFRKKNGLVFRQDYIKRAEEFYQRHGGKTVILARFVPIVRTFAPMVAGVGKMPRATFVFYNVIGAAVWTVSVVLLGYWLGSKIPDIDRYLLPAVGVASIFTFGPTIWHLMRDQRLRSYISQRLRKAPASEERSE